MADRSQRYATHRRFFPLFHFVAAPLLYANLGYRVWAARRAGGEAWWDVALAAGLVALLFAARMMALQVQNRVIRLEQRLRFARVLPPDLERQAERLALRQVIALRFASDEELPSLVRRCLAGELTGPDEIKREVRDWQPDTLRA